MELRTQVGAVVVGAVDVARPASPQHVDAEQLHPRGVAHDPTVVADPAQRAATSNSAPALTSAATEGRKERITPLTTEVCAVLRVWLAERRGRPNDAVFPSRRSGPLSSDAVARPCRSSRPHRSEPLSHVGEQDRDAARPAPRAYSPPASTPPSSPCGSATKASRQPRSTCTPTWPPRNPYSPAMRRPAPGQAAIALRTRCSPPGGPVIMPTSTARSSYSQGFPRPKSG